MHLKQLEYFRVLAKKEHYTKAAAELYITQPSLSYSISELEKELGTQLFKKEGRNVHLTKHGLFFLSYVEKGLAELETGKKELLKLIKPAEGKIDIAYLYNLGSHFIPTMIQAFLNKTKHENIEFSFDQGNTPDLINGLKKEIFDFVFCSYVENEPDINFIPITQEELVIIVSKDHPLAKLNSITLEEAAAFPFVFFNNKSGLRPIMDDIFKNANITPEIVLETELESAIVGLVEINFGIAIIPKFKALKEFNVKIIKIKNPIAKRLIYIASIRDKFHTPVMNSFRSFATNYGNENYLNVNRYI